LFVEDTPAVLEYWSCWISGSSEIRFWNQLCDRRTFEVCEALPVNRL